MNVNTLQSHHKSITLLLQFIVVMNYAYLTIKLERISVSTALTKGNHNYVYSFRRFFEDKIIHTDFFIAQEKSF